MAYLEIKQISINENMAAGIGGGSGAHQISKNSMKKKKKRGGDIVIISGVLRLCAGMSAQQWRRMRNSVAGICGRVA